MFQPIRCLYVHCSGHLGRVRYLVKIKPKRRNWKIPPGANLMAIKLGTVTSNCPQSRKISGTHRFHVRSTRGTERFLVRYISLAEPSLQLVWIGGAIVWEAIGTSRKSQTGKLKYLDNDLSNKYYSRSFRSAWLRSLRLGHSGHVTHMQRIVHER